jgi:ketol-acid reductoisomerase
VLIVDDIDLIITAVVDTSEDILKQNEAKKETMYDRIEAEMKGVQQSLYSSRIVSTVPSSSEGAEFGDEPTQLRRIEYATKARLRRV